GRARQAGENAVPAPIEANSDATAYSPRKAAIAVTSGAVSTSPNPQPSTALVGINGEVMLWGGTSSHYKADGIIRFARARGPASGALHACCGVVSNGCCDVSAAESAAVLKPSAAPPPPKPAIACTSWAACPELPMNAAEPFGGSTAIPATCQ